MRNGKWLTLISVAIFSVVVSPTILVCSELGLSGCELSYYEVDEYWSQRIIVIVMSAVFMLYVLIASRLIPYFSTIKLFMFNWVLGGVILEITKDEMYYTITRAFAIGFPQSDVWTDLLFSRNALWYVIVMGLIVAITTHHCASVLGTSNREDYRSEEDLELAIRCISETPPTNK